MLGHNHYIDSCHIDSMDAFKPLGGAIYRAVTADSEDVIRAQSNLISLVGQHDAWTVNMWVKPGWEHSDNSGASVMEMFNFVPTGAVDNTNDTVRCYYHRTNNRFFLIMNDTVGGTQRGRYNFWYVHLNSGTNPPGTQFGISSSTQANWWSASNPFHVNGDGWGMLTIMKHASTGAAWVNGDKVDLFWNGNICGTYATHVSQNPYYSAGTASGTGATSDSHFAWDTEVTNDFVLGSYPGGGNHGGGDHTGFSEISIWNKALTVSEVEELVTDHTVGDVSSRTATNPLKHSLVAENLLHYWPCHTGGTDFAQTTAHHGKTNSDIIVKGNNYIGPI